MRKEKYLLLGALMLLAVLAIAPAQAYVQRVSGVEAEIANANVISTATGSVHDAGGLVFYERPNSVNKVLCPVQLRYGNPAGIMYIRFMTQSSTLKITSVDVYDGPVFVKHIVPATGTSGATHVLTISTANRVYMNGLNIVLNIQNTGSTSQLFRLFDYGVVTTAIA